MERIEIPGAVTYMPFAVSDVFVTAPTISRVLLGATLPGQVVATAAMGVYAGSAARDWMARRKVRPIDFLAEYGADVFALESMPDLAREGEIRLLGHAMNEGFTAERRERPVLAAQINERLTEFIADITQQQLITSSQVRSFNLAKVIMPFAQGTCDVISGDVAIFNHSGVFEAHVIAHEFSHRKGYFKELHAQVLAFMAMRTSGDPLMIQAARAERLHRQLAVLSKGDQRTFDDLLNAAALRPELWEEMTALRPTDRPPNPMIRGMKAMYDRRMKLMGQNGISDYDEGFTNFLWTFSRHETAPQSRDHVAI